MLIYQRVIMATKPTTHLPVAVRHLRRSVIELAAALIVEPGNHVVRLTAAVVIDLDAKQTGLREGGVYYGILWDFMGFYGILWHFMGFYGDFMGFYGDLTVIEWVLL